MIFAARKLQGIGLIILLTFCALIVYPLSLRVSATRAELQRVEREIADTRLRNRMLQGDIAVLANPRQLDRWNAEYLGLKAPSAEQYLPGERALASLDRLRPADGIEPANRSLLAVASPVGEEIVGAAGSAGASQSEPLLRRRVALLDGGATTATDGGGASQPSASVSVALANAPVRLPTRLTLDAAR